MSYAPCTAAYAAAIATHCRMAFAARTTYGANIGNGRADMVRSCDVGPTLTRLLPTSERPDFRRCEQGIAPSHGRLVAFSTTDFSYHGHPHPLEPPPGRARRSLALYFYTRDFPADECEDRNCTVRMRTRWQDPKENGMCDAPAPRPPRVTRLEPLGKARQGQMG